ncbi:MAG: peptidoglycan editing factor PgeF [Patescibacteria group bacterium]|nr:peptidoglycan editing factor PgeF [Patescibacteria group bacterium]
MRFTNFDNIISGISEKKDGPMKSSLDNRLLFFKNEGLDKKIIVSAGLIHGNRVAIIESINKETVINRCDALITNNSKYLLAITVADCLPVYFFDNNKKVVALAHAGWRGIISKIISEVVSSFINDYRSNLSDINVFIGPHIQDCHFEVKKDVADYFKQDYLAINNGKKYINLSLAAKNQLIESGVLSSNISISDECTYCLRDKYFSFRRDNPENLETMIAYLSLK